MFTRILSNTRKQIARSGWVGWASVSVMTLAFLVAIIFGGLAYISNLYIQFIETKSNLLAFFEEGMDRDVIDRLRETWRQNPKVKDIAFTTEEQAYIDYSDYTSKVLPETYAILKTKETKILPSSLDVQIWSLDDIDSLKQDIERDIDLELKNLEIIKSTNSTAGATEETVAQDTPVSYPDVSDELIYKYQTDPSRAPIDLRVDDKNLDQLREVLTALRVAGIFVISLLFIVIFFFTFMTVEFRLYNQMEEIGVMQLVGGSLFFIRAPYILEGGFYGVVGSLLASTIIGTILLGVFVLDPNSVLARFFYENFSKLPWPYITPLGWGGVVGLMILIGLVLGCVSSMLSIKRYIR